MNEYDPDGDGICAAEFVLGQNDVVDYPDKTTDLAVNQGMFAVTMQVAKELGMPVTQDYIEKQIKNIEIFTIISEDIWLIIENILIQ